MFVCRKRRHKHSSFAKVPLFNFTFLSCIYARTASISLINVAHLPKQTYNFFTHAHINTKCIPATVFLFQEHAHAEHLRYLQQMLEVSVCMCACVRVVRMYMRV